MMRATTSRAISLLFLLAALATHARSQGADVRGWVSDSLTGQRIPFANVLLLGTTRGAATNGSGFYMIPRVPPGRYEISASVIGYRRKVGHVVVEPGKPIEMNFLLAASPVESEEVLVTGVRRREIGERVISAQVLEPKEMKLTPALVQEDIFQSLKMIPGVVSTNDVSSRFYVRGGAGDQNLTLLDGMRIYNPFHAMGIFSLFDPDIVQNVEMHTGAFPPGYGGVLSSVVSVTSRDGRSDRIAGRASVNFLSEKLQLEGPAVAGTTWMVNARKTLFGETFKRVVNKNVPASFFDVFSKFNVQLPGGAKMDLGMLVSSDEIHFPPATRFIYFSPPPEPDCFWRTSAASGTFSDLVGNRVFLQTSFYFTDYRATRDVKSATTGTPAFNRIKEHGIRVLTTSYTDAQNLVYFGFDFGFPSVEYRLTNTSGKPISSYKSYADGSIWLRYQARYSLWNVDAGIHADFGSIVAREQGLEGLQPRVTVTRDLPEGWKLRASAGLFSQRMITLNDEDDVLTYFDAWVKIPDGLSIEKAGHFVLGVEGGLDEATSIRVESYYKRYAALTVYNRNKLFASDPDYVTGTGNSYGVEALVRSKLWILDLYASYALGWTRVQNRGFDYYPRYDRRHAINLLVSAQPVNDLDLSLRWEFGSGFPFTASVGYYDRLRLGNPLTNPVETETGLPYIALGEKNGSRLPPYHRLDFSASFRFTVLGFKGSLGGQIMNVYDNINVFYFNRKTGASTNMLRFFPSALVKLEY